MSNINTVPGIDNAKLTAVARSLIMNGDDVGNTKLVKALNILIDGTPPVKYALSFDELEGLINIMDSTRPIRAKLDPAQWVIMTYQLNDIDNLLVEGYRITNYVIDFDTKTKNIIFTGTIRHFSTIPSHAEYDPTKNITAKEFEYTLGDFEILQQLAIARVISTVSPELEGVANMFDFSWKFEFNQGAIQFSAGEGEVK